MKNNRLKYLNIYEINNIIRYYNGKCPISGTLLDRHNAYFLPRKQFMFKYYKEKKMFKNMMFPIGRTVQPGLKFKFSGIFGGISVNRIPELDWVPVSRDVYRLFFAHHFAELNIEDILSLKILNMRLKRVKI